ncbi:MAG: hypothetical protein HKN80_02610 [Acidimicrobiia bacterium]|nr:hypothetical protein [Acidimicrobiia bacterium]
MRGKHQPSDAPGGVHGVGGAAGPDHPDADDVAMSVPGSILDWRVRGEDYLAGSYRIRLLEPRKWEVTHQGAVIAFYSSRKAAFGIAEDHWREAIRRRDLIRLALTFVLAFSAWMIAGLLVEELWVLALPVVLYFTLSSFIRFFAVFSRNVNNPYRRRLPWEKHPRGDRLFFRKR